MNADRLLAHYDRIADAPDAVPRLRRLILDLAVRGSLVEQDPNDEPASELLKRVAAEKARLVKAGEIKKLDVEPVGPGDTLFEKPNLWAWTRIGIAAYVEMGQSPPSEHYNQRGEGIPFFQGKADFGKHSPTTRYWCTQPTKYAEPGDILISVRAPVGPTNVADQKCCIGRGLAALRPYDGLYRAFLLLCLTAFEFRLAALGFGTTFVAINKKQLISFSLPLPPLAEQHRIVAKVDELMALCDRLEAARAEREATRDRLASASLARLDAPDPETFQDHARFALDALPALAARPDQIKQLRRTILNLAVRGKLVEQDPNDEPASELLKRIAAEKARLVKAGEIRKPKALPPVDEPPFGIPKSWLWARIRQTSSDRGQTVPEADFTYIDVTAIDKEKGVVAAPTVMPVNEAPSRARKIVRKGDVVYSCVRPYLLNVAIIDDAFDPPPIASTAFAILDGHGFVLPRFQWIVLRSPFMVAYVEEEMRGQAYPAINDTDFARLPFPLPPLAEQHRIVAKVDDLMALCDRLEASLATRDQTRHRLLDALLHQALAA